MKLLLVCKLLQLKKKREWLHQVLQQRESEGKKFCRLDPTAAAYTSRAMPKRFVIDKSLI